MRFMEVACDESGFSGSNLLDPASELITHAGVDLAMDAAAECVELIRARFQYSPTEYKSNQLLRSQQREVLEWLLDTLRGRGHVHLTDKRLFVVTRVLDLLLGEPTYAAGTSLAPEFREVARALHRDGPAAFGAERWDEFLAAFVTMMRTKRRRVINQPAIEKFYHHLDELRSGQFDEILTRLRASRPRAEEVLTLLLDDRSTVPPPLEPMLSALVDTTLYWSSGGRSVFIVHDEQSALRAYRVTHIQEVLAAAVPGRLPLLGVEMVDSRSDPRIQLADLLAGSARRIATAELHGQGDPGLSALLQPYVDRSSLWADESSWTRLSGVPGLSPFQV
jgi:hypothetical protein